MREDLSKGHFPRGNVAEKQHTPYAPPAVTTSWPGALAVCLSGS
jgi:hypothetical protein